MRRISATEAARGFADLLDDVEATGESVVIERRGKAVATIGP
ncbi:MAG: type II toxin-antitoxin system Phd/YefM family antitoxin, partial [Solirubrobacteraceae bacterium]|nr:type II toxin-antitoxin system Phd/YefM family antitoxin [Solirubrobacteraceae bacterium]